MNEGLINKYNIKQNYITKHVIHTPNSHRKKALNEFNIHTACIRRRDDVGRQVDISVYTMK